jgi:tetratricopeptide (TPR) repeat protein
MGPQQPASQDRHHAELGNLRAAIAFSLTQPDLEAGLRLATCLRAFWRARGHAAEGAGVLRALLEAPAAQQTTLLRGRALAAAVELLGKTGGYAVAEDYCEEALAIARAADDERLIADLVTEHAFIVLHQGKKDAALPLIESGLSLARRLGDPA